MGCRKTHQAQDRLSARNRLHTNATGELYRLEENRMFLATIYKALPIGTIIEVER